MLKRKLYTSLGLISILGLLCQGCQKNPERDYVINKNEGILEERLKEKETKKEKNPDTYQDEFENNAGDITVKIEAEIEDVKSKLPVVRVAPHEITVDEVKHWTNVLFEGEKAYEPRRELSKQEIEQEILQYKKLVNDRESLVKEYGSEEDAQKMIEYYKQEIDHLQKVYQTAPEKVEKIPCDWKFKPYDYYMTDGEMWEGNDQFEALKKTKELQAVTEELNGYEAIVSAVNRDEKDYRMHTLWFYYTKPELMTNIPYKKTSMEEAISLSKEIIEKLELGEWKLQYTADNSNENESRQSLLYTPTFHNVGVFGGNSIEIDLKSDELYASNYYYTKLEIGVFNGMIDEVLLTSPVDIVKIENDNVSTISFEEAYQAFKNQMQTKYTKNALIEGGEAEKEDVEIQVNHIVQGLFRIKEKGNEEEFLMVPAWAFKGEWYMNGESMGEQDFCVINAIDGSTIDVALGY